MISFNQLEYFVDRGYIRAGMSIMDVGTQNLIYANEDRAVAVTEKLRSSPLSDSERETVRKICHHTTPRPNQRTAYLCDLLELADVDYMAIDIFAGPRTTIFDLNRDFIPDFWESSFDIVINVGTLEHVINQAAAFQFIHDVRKVCGLWWEQSPSIGFLNHGYFSYHPQFYRDLAEANGYEIVEAWYAKGGDCSLPGSGTGRPYPTFDRNYALIDLDNLGSQNERDKIATAVNEMPHDHRTPAYNFNAMIRKTTDAPFRYPLEARTAGGTVSAEVAARYTS